jgi:hypothetical protein
MKITHYTKRLLESVLGIYILKQLVKATSDNYFYSLMATVKLSLMLTPFVYIYDKLFLWGFENQDYIFIVMGAILVDYIFGTTKHIFFTKDEFGRPTFTLKKNAVGLMLKLSLAVAVGFLFEGLSHLTKEATIIETSLKIITRVIVFMYPAISAWENIFIVSGEKFPPKKWMEKLGLYKESSNFKDLFDNDNIKPN